MITALQQELRFFCITRPRRFDKTVMANMIAAFLKKQKRNHCLRAYVFRVTMGIKSMWDSMM